MADLPMECSASPPKRAGRSPRPDHAQLTLSSCRLQGGGAMVYFSIHRKLRDLLGWNAGQRVAVIWDAAGEKGTLTTAKEGRRAWRLSKRNSSDTLDLRITVGVIPGLWVDGQEVLRWRREDEFTLNVWLPAVRTAIARSLVPRHHRFWRPLFTEFQRLRRRIETEKGLLKLWALRRRLERVIQAYRRCFWNHDHERDSDLRGTCQHCHEDRVIKAWRLCHRCCRQPAIRAQYITVRPKNNNPPCQHCHEREGYRPGQLCRYCSNDVAIRRLYIPEAPGWLPPDTLYPPWQGAYPDPGALPPCPHGLPDGVCAECERRQRAAMPALATTEEDA